MLMFLRRFRELISVKWPNAAYVINRSSNSGYLATIVVELMTLMTGVVALKLSAHVFGPVGFGEYTVARRALSMISFTVLCGLGISVPRFTALVHSGQENAVPRASYFVAGIILSLPLLCTLGILMRLFPGPCAKLFFGSSSFASLTAALLLCVIGIHLHSVVTGYFRGCLMLQWANSLQILNLTCVNIAALLLSGDSVERALVLMGSGWIVASTLFGFWILRGIDFDRVSPHILGRCIQQLFWYGAPRVPGEFSLFALFAVPVFIVANRSGLEKAGHLSLGISVIQLMGGMFSGTAALMLPVVSRLVSLGRWAQIKVLLRYSLGVSLLSTVAVVVLLELTLRYVLAKFMGDAFVGALETVRWLTLATIPYVVYVVIRNPLDAMSNWPYNSVNLAISLSLLVLLLWAGGVHFPVSFALLLSITLLSVLSAASLKTLLAQHSPDDNNR